jgi:hypothetical protein
MGTLHALVSAGGSPGVTTAALALALAWPAADSVIVAECDPSGGDALAGVLGGQLPVAHGLVQHAIEAGRDPQAAVASLAAELVPLDEAGLRLLLAGLTDPCQAMGLAQAWPAVAMTLAAQSCDVIADCGRLDAGPGQPLAVLSAAQTVVLVLRPTLRQVWAAGARIDMLTGLLGSAERLALLVTGPGTYSAREVGQALRLPILAALPDDPKTAAVLSDGIGRRGQLGSTALICAARTAGRALRERVLPGCSPAEADAGHADTLYPDTLYPDTLYSDTLRADAGQADSLQTETLQPDIPHAESLHAESLHADAGHADSLQTDALRPDALQSDTLHAADAPDLTAGGRP